MINGQISLCNTAGDPSRNHACKPSRASSQSGATIRVPPIPPESRIGNRHRSSSPCVLPIPRSDCPRTKPICWFGSGVSKHRESSTSRSAKDWRETRHLRSRDVNELRGMTQSRDVVDLTAQFFPSSHHQTTPIHDMEVVDRTVRSHTREHCSVPFIPNLDALRIGGDDLLRCFVELHAVDGEVWAEERRQGSGTREPTEG